VFSGRTVRRNVQGVDLYLPWSHVLPDYARARASYGQNLVELATALDDSDSGLRFVDVGANIGDSALQVLNRVDGSALCIEGDEYWARYLRMNAAEDPRVTIEEATLVPEGMEAAGLIARRSHGGSTAFVKNGSSGEDPTSISVEALKAQNPAFADARLIKSDTDGYDADLVPELARAWSDSAPVLFFEFDPVLSRKVAGAEPERLWSDLSQLGYSRLAIWDNTGDPVGLLDIDEAPNAAAILEPPSPRLGYTFWDVAACRADDAAAQTAFERLLSR
jgi:FkbM family methyltransferase